MANTGYVPEILRQLELEWKIRDNVLVSGENIYYETLPFYGFGKYWVIRIHPNGLENESEGWIGLYLVRKSIGHPITVEYSFSIKNVDEKMVTDTRIFQEKRTAWGFDKFILKSELIAKMSEFVPSDTVTIICSLKNFEKNDAADLSFHRHLDIWNLPEISVQGKRANLKHNCQEKDIHAGRTDSGITSPVSVAMYSHDTKENQTGEVSINDKERSTMENILLNISSINLNHPTVENISLFTAAEYMKKKENMNPVSAARCSYDTKENRTGEKFTDDKDGSKRENILSRISSVDPYHLTLENVISLYTEGENVKKMCVDFIIKNLSVESMCDIIKFAEKYKVEELSRPARKYFKENVEEILKSRNFKTFLKENIHKLL